ncbi:MAG: hypothetical protein A2089_03690 [Elusimicrobia bacterium GWD2_63_28]|nr:MAG: hypothetical protein A2089_03690 [Elusimicrobia bacterium GWD2_63_28]
MSKTQGVVVGIDLGTTNSAVSWVNEGKAETLRNAEGELMTPSVVAFPPGSSPLVGRTAVNQALQFETMSKSKRSMGKLDADGKPLEVYRDEKGKSYSAIDIAALILAKLKADAEAALGREIAGAVVSVPHYFSEGQRKATQQAAEIAGLKVLLIANEPVCAAIAYNTGLKSDETLLLCDFGGGTSDFTLLRKEGDELVVIDSDGDTNLGGEDITAKLVAYVEGKFNKLGVKFDRSSPEDMRSLQMIRDRSEQTKKILASKDKHVFSLEAKGKEVTFTYTQAELSELAKPEFDKIAAITSGLLGRSKAKPDKVLLVGGSSRLAAFRPLMAKVTGVEPLKEGIVDVDLAVAMGAGIYAAAEQAKKEGHTLVVGGARLPEIRDILTHSIGVAALLNGEGEVRCSVILERGFPLGCSDTKKYLLAEPTATSARIRLLEGEEGGLATECKEIFQVSLSNLPHEAVPTERIEVKLEITTSGILRCYARDTAGTGTVFKEIAHKTGLSDAEVQAKKKDLDSLRSA